MQALHVGAQSHQDFQQGLVMVGVVLLRRVLVLVDGVDFEGGVHFHCLHLLVLVRDQLDGQQVVFDVDGDETQYVLFVVDFVDGIVECAGSFLNLLDPELQLLLDFEGVPANELVPLDDVDVRVDDPHEKAHEGVDGAQVQTAAGEQ